MKKLKIGTTFDYRPFTYIENNQYKGYDIEIIRLIGKELDLKIEFIKTTWKSLKKDLIDEKFDIAIGGITKTEDREKELGITKEYYEFGKCFLVRREDKEKYISLDSVNKKEVRVGVNIGGTNEIFARDFLTKSKIIKYEDNLEVPLAVSNNEVDVMVTEVPEAIVYEKINPNLLGILTDKPLTKNYMVYLVKKEQEDLKNEVNKAITKLEKLGIMKKLENKYLNI